MTKTTVYLPDDLEVRLDAESAATGISKAELIRRAITLLLDSSTRPRASGPLPVFHSGRRRTPEDMDAAIADRVRERASRR